MCFLYIGTIHDDSHSSCNFLVELAFVMPHLEIDLLIYQVRSIMYV